MAQLILIKTVTAQSHIDDLVGFHPDGTIPDNSHGYQDLNVVQVAETPDQIQDMINGVEKLEDTKYHVNIPSGDLTKIKACTE